MPIVPRPVEVEAAVDNLKGRLTFDDLKCFVAEMDTVAAPGDTQIQARITLGGFLTRLTARPVPPDRLPPAA